MFSNLARSTAKRMDAVFSLLGMPDRFPVATHARSHRRWVADNGDHTHRFNYELTEDDVVFDVGGYQGDWAAEIHQRFGCEVHVFEPLPAYCDAISARFQDNPKIHAHCCGLADADGTFSLSILDDSTSQFKSAAQSEQCQLKSITAFLKERSIDQIALMKLNIEGGEYDLLDHIIEQNLVRQVRHLQIQFHWFVPDARRRMEKIQDAFRATHSATYQYPFVWENWTARAA